MSFIKIFFGIVFIIVIILFGLIVQIETIDVYEKECNEIYGVNNWSVEEYSLGIGLSYRCIKKGLHTLK